MADCYVITWESDKLCLDKKPTEGVWQKEESHLAEYEIECPTRTARLQTGFAKDNISSALKELLKQAGEDIPVHFLMPRSWLFTFRLQCPEFSTDKQKQDHIIWETKQRVREDVSEYTILVEECDQEDYVDISAIRSKLLEVILNVAENIDLKIDTLYKEPKENEKYKLGPENDFKSGLKITRDDMSAPEGENKSLLPIFGFIVFVTIIIAIIGYLFNSSYFSKQDRAEKGYGDTLHYAAGDSALAAQMQDSIAGKPLSAALSDSIDFASLRAGDYSKYTGPPPFAVFRNYLPNTARIEMLIMSPVMMRIEVSGLDNSDSILNIMRKINILSDLEIAAQFIEKGEPITVFSQNHSGLDSGQGSPNREEFKKKALELQMKVSGRTARGVFDDAVKFVDSLWEDMHGYRKLFLARDRVEWVVTVQ